MSASFFGGEVKDTKRYRLGQLLGRLTRHFLLMTATPHNGKPEDFQLFMALLDGDRFEGKFRDGVHTADISDLMRRLGEGAAAQIRRHSAVPRTERLHRQLQALRRRSQLCTRASPITSARSSIAPTRWKTRAARAQSDSP